ncbi:response regulator [Rhodoferax sp.]|jgi:excisionase family DNA binding protein|uniref:response regulator n=1 Tax=Rhodoferax sp. TaxID=50421 RepID=UPI003782DE87
MRKTAANDDVMTTRQAGEALGVAVRTVQLWVESGVLSAWRTAGGHRRIARSAVERLLADRARSLVVGASTPPIDVQAFSLLLVEDDVHLVRLFSSVVQSWGLPIRITVAGNGFEGLVRIGEIAPDMVVTDLVMPGMDGIAMLRALKKPGSGFAKLSVVAVSALSTGEIRAQGGLPDGVAYLPKPLDYHQLEALVRRGILQRSQ